MNSRVKYWLRWILVLPGAFGMASVMTTILTCFYSIVIFPFIKWAIVGYAIYFAKTWLSTLLFIFGSMQIAPSNKKEVGILFIAISGIMLFLFFGVGFTSEGEIPTNDYWVMMGSLIAIIMSISDVFKRPSTPKVKPIIPNKMPESTLNAMRLLYNAPHMTEEQARAKMRAAKAWTESQTEQ